MGGLPFAAPLYRPGDDKIAELLIEQGRARAAAAQQQGQIWGNALANIGQGIGGAIAAEPQRRLEAARARREEALATATEQQNARLTKQDEAFSNLLSQTQGQVDPLQVMKIYGPQRGLEVIKGLSAFQEMSQKKGQEALQHAPEVIRGWSALGEGMRAQTWPMIRQQAITTGLFGPEHLPEQYTPELGAQIVQWGKSLAGPEKLTAVGPEQRLVNPEGKVVVEGQPKKETRTVDEQLAEAKLAGDSARYSQLLAVKAQAAAAGRDPNAAAERQATRSDARLDKSYQFNSTQLEAARKPLMDQAERFGRLVETINQKTPQADALLAPELLTVMAGGAGSGLRMNEAEISRVIGGRSNLESLKAALNKWSPDSGKALSVTDAQRAQMQRLIDAMHKRITEKVGAIDQAAQELVDAKDVESHRKIVSGLKAKLTDMAVGSEGVTVTAPNGKVYTFPNKAQADGFKKRAGIQ